MSKKSPATISLAELKTFVGKEMGKSEWRTISQDMIDQFADVTDDHQFIHVDPARAKQTHFGGTIAHGFLTLSLLSAFGHEALPTLQGTELGINKGFDRLRFVSPVRSGARVRGSFVLGLLDIRSTGFVETGYDVTVEIEGADKPAMVARWLTVTKVDVTGDVS